MTTPRFYDTRSQRQVAAGLAEQYKAEAAVKAAEAQLAMAGVQAAQAEAAERLATQRSARLRAEREADRAERRQRRAALVAWISARWHLALWLPVIIAPGILAWQAQSASGDAVFGTGLGWLLALFTETSAWALLARAQIRRQAGLPAGATTAAVWLVAAVSAALNYTHGAADPGASWHGVVMALVSVSGIAVHQISHWRTDVLTAIRTWWTSRTARRLQRAARRRVARFERAAVRSATAVLHVDGRVELRYPDGPVALSRFGRRLTEAPAYSLTEDVARMIDRTAAVTGYRPVPMPGSGPVNLHEHPAPSAVAADASDPDRELYLTVCDLIAHGELAPSPTGWRIYTHVMNRAGDKARAYRVAALLADDQTRPHSIEQEEVA